MSWIIVGNKEKMYINNDRENTLEWNTVECKKEGKEINVQYFYDLNMLKVH